MDQPGKVANPARGQLNREKIFPCPRACLRIWSRETGSAVPSRVSLLIISILRLNLVLTYEIPSEFRILYCISDFSSQRKKKKKSAQVVVQRKFMVV